MTIETPYGQGSPMYCSEEKTQTRYTNVALWNQEFWFLMRYHLFNYTSWFRRGMTLRSSSNFGIDFRRVQIAHKNVSSLRTRQEMRSPSNFDCCKARGENRIFLVARVSFRIIHQLCGMVMFIHCCSHLFTFNNWWSKEMPTKLWWKWYISIVYIERMNFEWMNERKWVKQTSQNQEKKL